MPTPERQFAEALGLHESVVRDIDGRGQLALIDRVQGMDKSGALGRVLSMTQQMGMFMDQRSQTGQPVPPQEQASLVAEIAQAHGVNPQLALRVVGAVTETFGFVMSQLANKERLQVDEMERMEDARAETNQKPASPPTAGAGGPGTQGA